MSETLAFNNLLTWSLQIALVTAIAALTATALRVRLPAAKLAYWQLVLTACILLPFLRTWQRETIVFSNDPDVSVSISTHLTPAPSAGIPVSSILLWVLLLGAAIRFARLLTGLWRMSRYRRRSVPLDPPHSWSAEAQLRVSGDVSSPVTFGFLRPVVLLPSGFTAMPEAQREAILCHEVMHVRRKDWLFTVGEELVRTAFWFHPAIWWILGEIQLAREQAVDLETIGMTRARDEYVDALLAVAGASPQPDLAAASPFLRRRHLKQRVVSIFEEVRMSKTRSLSALAASLVLLAASCWFVTGVVPLYGAPQLIADGAGVAVEMNGASLMHRNSVAYPAEAMTKHVEGTVVALVKVDASGNVLDASIVSGPDELRKAVLQSVLNWHFTKESANSARQVTISFRLPPQIPVPSEPARGAVVPPTDAERTLKVISVRGLAGPQRDELISQLPVREGDTLTAASAGKVAAAVRNYDEHFRASVSRISPTESALLIDNPDGPSATPYSGPGLRVGGDQQQAKLLSQRKPLYPPEAKASRVQGVVKLEAVIGKDGTVQSLQLASGHPMLAQAALDAVRQWVYQPTLLNGNPIEVVTTIDVNFTLLP